MLKDKVLPIFTTQRISSFFRCVTLLISAAITLDHNFLTFNDFIAVNLGAALLLILEKSTWRLTANQIVILSSTLFDW